MKSYEVSKNEAKEAIKKTKKENAADKISKSAFPQRILNK